jgi:hypothetical protein
MFDTLGKSGLDARKENVLRRLERMNQALHLRASEQLETW